MVFDIIAQGDKVELAEKRGDSNYILCSGKLLSCNEEGMIEIVMPLERMEQAGLKIKGSYQACFFTTKGVFCAEGEIVCIDNKKEQLHITISFITGLERLHYRRHYRYSARFEIKYSEAESEEWRVGTAVDISGGGCRFNSAFPNEKGTIVKIEFPFEKKGKEVERTIEAVVIWSEPIEYKKGYYENRVEFINVSQNFKEFIIQYIFEKEKETRMKERRLY